MKFFSQLFDSDWRNAGDTQARARQSHHYGSMAEQVMANRNEIMFLQSEVDRVSQDLARSMQVNRTLLKLLLSEGVCSPETLEELLAETMAQSQQDIDPENPPSRFCEDCGRPLPRPGHNCPYCAEVAFQVKDEEPPAEAKKKKKKSKKKSEKKKSTKKS